VTQSFPNGSLWSVFVTTLARPRTDHLALARAYAARPLEPRFDPTRRWYQRLTSQDDVEVWLLSWLPGQGTELHDHGGSAGAFVVASGTLTERTVSAPATLVSNVLSAGTGRWFGPYHVHQVVNTSDAPAVSVHVYGPALTTMTRYSIEDGRLRVAAVDRAGEQW
jgi:predicted metal-dependent enzyme (double-stranded beta helix superfamily)